jgi:hypothetical protein
MLEKQYKLRPPVVDLSYMFPATHVVDHEYTGIGASSIVNIRSVATLLSATHSRTVKYHFTCPELKGTTARLRQFVDAFGVFDPAALWDIVPWSFVIDWMVGIGPWLHKHKPQFFPATLNIDDYCETVRVEYLVEWYVTYNGCSFSAPSDIESDGTYTEKIGTEVAVAYHRRPYQPTVFRSIKPGIKSPFSHYRLGISSALLGQRLIPRGH